MTSYAFPFGVLQIEDMIIFFSFSKSRTRQYAVDKGGVALTGGKILCEEVPSDSEFDISHFERYRLHHKGDPREKIKS